MRKGILVLLCIVIYVGATAQQGSVLGQVRDTAEQKDLENAVVLLSRTSDSVLVAFTRTGKDGHFELFQIPMGTYTLHVTFPKFADLIDNITVKDSAIAVGTLALTQRAALLQEVIVRTGSAIRIKGDTTEFTADSFVVKEGATVEDLLKKLPGFTVNTKGEITAQGKRVGKVLVEGEEFFGDDPTLATQNLGAKQVDKIQLYEAKTDQEQLTGVANSNAGKTLNIKLKDGSKKGSFAKLSAGTDFQKYNELRAIYNRFNGNQKISAYASKSDISTGSLNWEDQRKLGVQDDVEYDEISGYYYSFGQSDEFNDWSLRGLPHAYTAGALYSNKWDEDKQTVNLSYRYNRLRTENQTSTYTQNILPTTINYRNKFAASTGLNEQHAGNAKWEWKLDSLASLKLVSSGAQKQTDLLANVASEFLNGNREFVNQSNQIRNSSTTQMRLDNQLTYKQLFHKKDRQLLATLRFGSINDKQHAMNLTQTRFFRNNAADSLDIIDQLMQFDGLSKTLGGKLTYSEPLNTKLKLVFDYGYTQNNSTAYRNTFNKDNNGKYERLDTVFSNNFDLRALSHSGLGLLRYTSEKWKGVAGSGLSTVQLNLHNLDDRTRTIYNFTNYTPQFQLAFTPKPQTNLNFYYRGITMQPNIQQLQPIRNNEDPLYQFQGNPDLKVGFNHEFNLRFNQGKTLKQRYLYLSLNGNIYTNAITNYTIIDTTLGKQIYTPVNVDGNRNWGFYGGWQRWRGSKQWSYGVSANANGGINNNFIQQSGLVTKNKTTYNQFTFAPSLNYQEDEKINFGFRPNIGYTLSQSSIQPDVDNNFFTYGGNIDFWKSLLKKFELSTDVNFDLRQRLPQFPTNQNFTIWNASLAYKLFKKKTGKIIFEAHDILDQNRGYNRVINSSFVQEERYNRLSRYFLLRFEWNFTKMPGAPSK